MKHMPISPPSRDQLLENGLQLRTVLQESVKHKGNRSINLEQVLTSVAYFVNEVEMFLDSQKV